jgi:hypothetical protein
MTLSLNCKDAGDPVCTLDLLKPIFGAIKFYTICSLKTE